MVRRSSTVAAIALIAALISSPAFAQQSDEWEFTLSPYLWLSGLDGTVGVRGLETSVDLSAGDVLENLETAALVRFEARKSRWAVLFDTVVIASQKDTVQPPGVVDIDQVVFEFGGAYRLNDVAEILVGGRWVSINTNAQLNLPMQTLTASNDQDWVEPFAGIRLGTDLNDRWLVGARGDIGGLGFGSTMMWNVEANLGFRVTPHISILAGYRVLDIDHDDDNNLDSLLYDVKTGGPIIRFDFGF